VSSLTSAVSDPVNARTLRATLRALRSFAIVGVIGFLVEALILTVLVSFAGWGPWRARVPSFLIAVTVTWLLNRTLTFPGRGLQRRSLEALLYIATMALGSMINLAVYGLMLFYIPRLAALPVIPLGLGSAASLMFNFSSARLLVFARPRGGEQ
jgi:putative flippase GtrA